jgi:hypothetical protein
VPETASRNQVVVSATAPAVTNDWTEGFRPGDIWRDTATSKTYICTAHQPTGAAVWTEIINSATIPASPAYIHLQDRKASATAGGTATAGSWFTRELNTELIDTGSHCTLSSNQFELPAGTYLIEAKVPAYRVNGFKARLYNVTDAAVQSDGTNEIYSTNGYSAATNATMTHVFLRGRFTLGATKTLRIEMQVVTTFTTNGCGVQTGLGPEIYTEVWLTKLS